MKNRLWVGAAVIAILIVLFAVNSYTENQTRQDSMPQSSNQPVQVIPISHATAVLKWGDIVFYVDPVGGAQAFDGQPTADVVLVTDIHGDHLSTSTLAEVVAAEATLIVPQAVQEQLSGNLASQAKVLANGESFTERGFLLSAVPMYNLPDASNSNFHAKGRGNGYIIEKDGFRVYVAGDTAGTPEMRALRDIDIALVPMNLPYTMSVDEAVDAVLAFKPKQAYPYHYRGQGGLADVNRFKELVNAKDPNIEVVLADWYPEQ